VRIELLGPMRLWRNGAEVTAGSPLQQATLAMLVLRPGGQASMDALVDGLYGERPPMQAGNSVRTYVSRVRRNLPQPDWLVYRIDGYQLDPQGLEVDLFEAERLSAEAARAPSDDDRAGLLDRALGLWRGGALLGVPGPYAQRQRDRLAGWRLTLQEDRLETALRLGDTALVRTEAPALIAEHHLRERLHGLLIHALHREGRRVEALAAYADTRRVLAEELGVEPSASLRALHRHLLAEDAEDAEDGAAGAGAERPRGAASGSRAARWSVPTPAQLPLHLSDFTGRTDISADLMKRITTVDERAVSVTALSGMGGIGKTTLAVHLAHGLRTRYCDGQLYVDLRGAEHDPALPLDVLGQFLQALGVPPDEQPSDATARAALFRSLVDGRRMLILLDNAHDEDQVRPLLPGAAGCAVLVTSRTRLGALPGAHLVDLGVLRPEESWELLRRVAGAQRVAAEPEAARALLDLTAHLPLAVRIVAARLAVRPRWPVAAVVARLHDEQRRLPELSIGDQAVETSFELGYTRLAPPQQWAFRLLAASDAPDFFLQAAAAVLQVSAAEAEEICESLVDVGMMECTAPGRYRYHDLLRLFARSRTDPAERAEALARLLRYVLARARDACRSLWPHGALPDHPMCTAPDHSMPPGSSGPPGSSIPPGTSLPPAPSLPPDPSVPPGASGGAAQVRARMFHGPDEARAWLRAERGTLHAALRQADDSTLRLAVGLFLLCERLCVMPIDAHALHTVTDPLLARAQRIGDTMSEAGLHLLRALSGLYEYNTASAAHHVARARHLADRNGDRYVELQALQLGAVTALYQAQPLQALRLLERCAADATELDHPSAAIIDRGMRGFACALLGRHGESLTLAREAAALAEDAEPSGPVGHTLVQVSATLRLAGHPREALALMVRWTAQMPATRPPGWTTMALIELAECHRAVGEGPTAITVAEHALAAGRQSGRPYGQARALLSLARIRGDATQAREAAGQLSRLGAPEASLARRLAAELDGLAAGAGPVTR
jgi:DNA-binding SARP family transcriptional activator